MTWACFLFMQFERGTTWCHALESHVKDDKKLKWVPGRRRQVLGDGLTLANTETGIVRPIEEA